jgi:hypothetical protein
MELYARSALAWELRDKPGFADAVAALLDAYDRAPLTYFEEHQRRQERNEWLIGLVRDPAVAA